MKRILGFVFALLCSQTLFAGSGKLFHVSAFGTPTEAVSLALCLNGHGPVSCQSEDVSALEFSVRPTVPGHRYPAIGIKVNTPGYTITSGCTAHSNGYCLFSASNTEPQTIRLTRTEYSMVFDAGSSGTRVYLYQTTTDATQSNPLIVTLYNERNFNPLASCTTDTEVCVDNALQGLLDNASRVLQEYAIARRQVSASVLGTAGMRLIPLQQQAAIYRAAAELIRDNRYIVGQTRTITGQQEGFYQWLNVNYLSNSLGLPFPDTFGVVEMGGASAQVAFVTSSPSPNVIPLTINGTDYNLFSISFLGLGQNQARNAMNALPFPAPTYCYQNTGNFTLPGCLNNFDDILSRPPFSELATLGSLGEFSQQSYYGVDNIYVNLHLLNVPNPPDQTAVESAIMTRCSNQGSTSLSDTCANTSYVDAFLYASPHGLSFGSNTLIPVEKINDVLLTWTLGYVYLDNKMPKICDMEVCSTG